MAAAIGLRDDYDAGALRAAAKRSKDGRQARRLLALAAIYDGVTRTEAAKIGGVGLQGVRDWVLKFNAQGPDGLIDRKAPGQSPRGGTRRIARRWRRSSRAGRSRRFMASCDGGSSISANGFSRNSGSSSPSRRLSRVLRARGIASSRPVPGIMRKPRARSRILKKFPRAPGGDRAREERRSGRDRGLVC